MQLYIALYSLFRLHTARRSTRRRPQGWCRTELHPKGGPKAAYRPGAHTRRRPQGQEEGEEEGEEVLAAGDARVRAAGGAGVLAVLVCRQAKGLTLSASKRYDSVGFDRSLERISMKT